MVRFYVAALAALALAGCNANTAGLVAGSFTSGVLQGWAEASRADAKRRFEIYAGYPDETRFKIVADAQDARCERLEPEPAATNAAQGELSLNKHVLQNRFRCEADGHIPLEFAVLGIRFDYQYPSGEKAHIYRSPLDGPLQIIMTPSHAADHAERDANLAERAELLEKRLAAWRVKMEEEWQCGENADEPACKEFAAGVREIMEDAAAARSEDAAAVKTGQTS